MGKSSELPESAAAPVSVGLGSLDFFSGAGSLVTSDLPDPAVSMGVSGSAYTASAERFFWGGFRVGFGLSWTHSARRLETRPTASR